MKSRRAGKENGENGRSRILFDTVVDVPLVLDVSLHFVQLFAKHPTRLEIQHTLVSSTAEDNEREEEAVNHC